MRGWKQTTAIEKTKLHSIHTIGLTPERIQNDETDQPTACSNRKVS